MSVAIYWSTKGKLPQYFNLQQHHCPQTSNIISSIEVFYLPTDAQ